MSSVEKKPKYRKRILIVDDSPMNREILRGMLEERYDICEAENGQPYGMILCGKESTDEISGQVGARLAEILGTGFVSSVIEVEPQDESFVAKQETEEGYIRYSVAQPAVFTIAKPAYDPRYPNIKAKLAARKAIVPVFAAADTCFQGRGEGILKGLQ